MIDFVELHHKLVHTWFRWGDGSNSCLRWSVGMGECCVLSYFLYSLCAASQQWEPSCEAGLVACPRWGGFLPFPCSLSYSPFSTQLAEDLDGLVRGNDNNNEDILPFGSENFNDNQDLQPEGGAADEGECEFSRPDPPTQLPSDAPCAPPTLGPVAPPKASQWTSILKKQGPVGLE